MNFSRFKIIFKLLNDIYFAITNFVLKFLKCFPKSDFCCHFAITNFVLKYDTTIIKKDNNTILL